MKNLLNNEDILEFVNDNEKAIVIWHSEDCPVCEQFLEEMGKIESSFVIGLVSKQSYKQLLIEPSIQPTSFIFVDGIRKYVPIGFAPKDAIEEILNRMIDGTFKTEEQIEQEQLDKLETKYKAV
jgi:hypothetical protein